MIASESIRAYLDDLLCTTKASLDGHLDHLRLILTRLREAVLKVNSPKLKFCAIEMEYLGYIITRTGIKPQQNKVRMILAISLPKQANYLHRSLGMLQYHIDLWVICSEMLASLTSLVGKCSHTKVTRAKKTKKHAWYWDEVHQIAFDKFRAQLQ